MRTTIYLLVLVMFVTSVSATGYNYTEDVNKLNKKIGADASLQKCTQLFKYKKIGYKNMNTDKYYTFYLNETGYISSFSDGTEEADFIAEADENYLRENKGDLLKLEVLKKVKMPFKVKWHALKTYWKCRK